MMFRINKLIPLICRVPLGVMFPILLGVFIQFNSAAASPSEISTNLSTPFAFPLQTPTPPSQMPILQAEQRDRFAQVAGEFSHPLARPTSTGPVNAKKLIDASDEFNGFEVEFQGTVRAVSQVDNLLDQDWQTAYVIIVDDGSNWMPVLYRGDVADFIPGAKVKVSGAFSAAGKAVYADWVALVKGQKFFSSALPLEITISLACELGIGILLIILLLFPRKVSQGVGAILLLITLSACEFQMETVVTPDGKVRTTTRLTETVENTKFLKSIPGVERYLNTWIANLRENGLLVANETFGNQEEIVIQKDYPDLISYSKGLQETIPSNSWVYIAKYQSGEKTCFRYLSQISPQSLQETPANTSPDAASQINQYFNDMQFIETVSLPGQVRFTNASSVTGNQAEWIIDTQRTNQLVAESCQMASDSKPGLLWLWTAVLGSFLIDLGLFFLLLQKIRRKPKQQNP